MVNMSAFLHEARASVLQRIANDEPAADILRGLCLAIERELVGTIVGVTILDRTAQLFEHAIFPSLSDAYADALRGIEVAGKPGSCALAVFEGRTVECTDVASDERFSAGWRTLGQEHGLRALVSIPALHADGFALGTLVVAYPPESPLQAEQRLLADELAKLCALILNYRRTQMRHELLIGELQHRLRNLFSTIGAVVYATLKSHPEPDTFRKTFDGRLMALSRAHSIALEKGEADLRQLLVDTLAPYSIDHPVSVDGPKLLLAQEAAVAFSLAAHELATNAAKYGAFSKSGGSVGIRWNIETVEGEPRFSMTWEEQGGPEVRPPSRQGFGQRTLKRSIASAFDGAIELDYRPGGLRCRVTAPHTSRIGVWAN
jgi:two-component sensor histidine kinase